MAGLLGIMLMLDLLIGFPFLMIVVGTRVEERRKERRSPGSSGQLPPGRGLLVTTDGAMEGVLVGATE